MSCQSTLDQINRYVLSTSENYDDAIRQVLVLVGKLGTGVLNDTRGKEGYDYSDVIIGAYKFCSTYKFNSGSCEAEIVRLVDQFIGCEVKLSLSNMMNAERLRVSQRLSEMYTADTIQKSRFSK